MDKSNRAILGAFIFSLFSLSLLQVGVQLGSKSQPQSQVLGIDTYASSPYPTKPLSSTPTPFPISPTPQSFVPCSVVRQMAQNYCGYSSNPTLTPTPKYTSPTPTGPRPTTCKNGINEFSVLNQCPSPTSIPGMPTPPITYHTLVFTCYDGYQSTISSETCLTQKELYSQALPICQNHGSCY
jgi:hypothetical protein